MNQCIEMAMENGGEINNPLPTTHSFSKTNNETNIIRTG